MVAHTILAASEELLRQPLGEQAEHQWCVLHVKSRPEKALSDDLAAMDIAHDLPLLRQQCSYGTRRAIVEVPWFPSCLRLRGTREDAYGADRTKRLVNVIHVADQRQIDWELRKIYLALANPAPLDPGPCWTAGVRVRVRSGPVRGLEGVIENRSKAGRLILQVSMLGSASSLEIDGSLLDVLE